jgi:hypothetical protein
MHRSQVLLRTLFVAASLGLAATTLLAAVTPQWEFALVLAVVTAALFLRPASHLVALLLLGHALHWLVTVRVPDSWAQWVLAGLAGVLGLVLHTSAALAASVPPSAPLPRGLARRWAGRTALVTAGSVPVWLVAVSVTRAATAGDLLFTYAALAACALLALALWLVAREPQA